MTVHVRKKRRIEKNVTEEAFGQVVGDIDLEIGIRRRLAEAVEARITWATLLQESLQNGQQDSPSQFKGAAIEALDAIETPLNPIFLRDPFPPSWVPRPLPVRKEIHSLPAYKPPVKPSKPSFLYIRSAYLDPSNPDGLIQTYLLRCPQCLRTSFTSLQGLLNHARLSHKLEWGTHDDCVRACAVADPELDINMGYEVGLATNGLLPGLRSLFKMAVEGSSEALTPAMDPDIPTAPDLSATSSGSHLNKTLGLHEDSPALAPFLGKETIRRGIKVWDEDLVNVDGHSASSGTALPQATWRMQYSQRNNTNPTQKDAPTGVHTETNDQAEKISQVETPAPSNKTGIPTFPEVGTNSRFHFSTRLVILDQSLWIPPGKRIQSEATHKWMLSVDATSYSHHVSTVLHKMSVSPLSGDDFSPKEVTKPPFAVVGRASQPFLAKIELSFAPIPDSYGQSVAQKVILDHWVELDLAKKTYPVGGDEQVVDVELDRRTGLRPLVKDYTPLGARSLWNDECDLEHVDSQAGSPIPVHERILVQLLEKFPMTAKDIGRNQSLPELPYKIPTAPYQLKNMVMGKRKALEWGRANAIHGAFVKIAEEPEYATQALPTLSTGDIYRWLSDEGHFHRTPSQNLSRGNLQKLIPEDRLQPKSWCPVCGRMQISEGESIVKHDRETPFPPIKQELEEAGNSRVCECNDDELRTKMPLVDVNRRLHTLPEASTPFRGSTSTLNLPRDDLIIARAEPQMTHAVWNIVKSLKLPNIPPNFESIFPVEQLGPNPSTVQSALAPYAIMALMLKPLVRELVQSGLEHSSKTKEGLNGATSSKKKRASKKGADRRFDLLTPTQILNGIAARAKGSQQTRGDTKNIAIYELLTRLGTPVEPSKVKGEVDSARFSHDNGVHVKLEPTDM